MLLVIGAALGWVANGLSASASENAAIIDEHIRDIERFNEKLQDYWLSPVVDQDSELAKAARVRACQAALTPFYGTAKKKLRLTSYRKYQMLHLRLYQCGTGGKFETADRKPDAAVAIECYDLCAQLVHLLRLARKEQVSVMSLWPKAAAKHQD